MTANVYTAAEAESHAIMDLAARLAIPAKDVKVLESGEAMWPDAGLGIPEPGMMYAQVLTEGFHVLLEAAGKTYEYHFGNGIVKMRPVNR